MNLRYNQISYKHKQCPATVSRLFCPRILGKRAFTRTGVRTSLGELGSGNAPAVLCSRSSPTFIGGSKNPKTQGGYHA